MGLTDVLVVLGVFTGLGYVILARINERSPNKLEWIKGLFSGGIYKKESAKENLDKLQQVYDEKRTMM